MSNSQVCKPGKIYTTTLDPRSHNLQFRLFSSSTRPRNGRGSWDEACIKWIKSGSNPLFLYIRFIPPEHPEIHPAYGFHMVIHEDLVAFIHAEVNLKEVAPPPEDANE